MHPCLPLSPHRASPPLQLPTNPFSLSYHDRVAWAVVLGGGAPSPGSGGQQPVMAVIWSWRRLDRAGSNLILLWVGWGCPCVVGDGT